MNMITTIILLANTLKQTNDGNGILTGETQLMKLKAMEQPQQDRHQHPVHQ
jgi:hypothetical protein